MARSLVPGEEASWTKQKKGHHWSSVPPLSHPTSLGCKDIKGRGEADVEFKVTADPFPSMRKVFLVLFYSQGSLGIQLRGSVGARFLNKYKSRD